MNFIRCNFRMSSDTFRLVINLNTAVYSAREQLSSREVMRIRRTPARFCGVRNYMYKYKYTFAFVARSYILMTVLQQKHEN